VEILTFAGVTPAPDWCHVVCHQTSLLHHTVQHAQLAQTLGVHALGFSLMLLFVHLGGSAPAMNLLEIRVIGCVTSCDRHSWGVCCMGGKKCQCASCCPWASFRLRCWECNIQVLIVSTCRNHPTGVWQSLCCTCHVPPAWPPAAWPPMHWVVVWPCCPRSTSTWTDPWGSADGPATPQQWQHSRSTQASAQMCVSAGSIPATFSCVHATCHAEGHTIYHPS
jgi:hypothetical protein